MRNFEGEPQTPENPPSEKLLEKLQAEDPDREVVFIAIEKLKDEKQIKEFFQQYVESLTQGDPYELAKRNIGYVLGYYDQKTVNRWEKALPEAKHPLFGGLSSGEKKKTNKAGVEKEK